MSIDRSGAARARALVAKAWRARREALQSRLPDHAALAGALAPVETDLVRACGLFERAAGKGGEQASARKGLSVALGKLAHVALDLEDLGRARTLFRKSVAIARQAGDPLRLAHALRHLGQVDHRLGRLEAAAGCYDEALDLYDRSGAAHPLDHANALRPMALLREELGDPQGARGTWRRAAEMYRSAGVAGGVRECEAHLAELAT